MIFVLIRHGHKTIEPPDDPSLSAKGHDQARKLLQLVKNNTLPAPTHCIYSDRKRTQETLQELIVAYKPKSEPKLDLNLRTQNETSNQFHSRVQKLVNYYTYQATQPENKNQVVYACTHYDWVEEAMTVIESDKNLNSFEFAGWAPGNYIVFQINEDGLWHYLSRGGSDG